MVPHISRRAGVRSGSVVLRYDTDHEHAFRSVIIAGASVAISFANTPARFGGASGRVDPWRTVRAPLPRPRAESSS